MLENERSQTYLLLLFSLMEVLTVIPIAIFSKMSGSEQMLSILL